MQRELVALQVEDVGAGDVGRQSRSGVKLDTRELAAEDRRERAAFEQGLRHPRAALR
jgi:hypothetical protein